MTLSYVHVYYFKNSLDTQKRALLCKGNVWPGNVEISMRSPLLRSATMQHYRTRGRAHVTNAASPGICRSGFSPAVQPGLTPEFTRPTLSDAQDILQNDAWRWWVADVSLPVRISWCVFSKATFKTETFVSTDSTSCEQLTFLQSRQAISIINDV